MEKLRADAEDCLMISEAGTSYAKSEVFRMLAATYQKLAADLEGIVALNLIADGEREKRLIGLLSGDDGIEHLAEIAKLLGQHSGTNDGQA
jgi:hypothetical protein